METSPTCGEEPVIRTPQSALRMCMIQSPPERVAAVKWLSLAERVWLWLALAAFVSVSLPSLAQPAAKSDPHLDTKVKYATQQASVQDVAQNLAQQAGLKYDRQKSFTRTDPLCRQWVRNVAIDGKTCREALDQILKPVGLSYELQADTIILARLSTAAVPANQGPGAAKFDAARKALTGSQKNTARAKTLLLELAGKDKATIDPGSLCYAYVYLGYIEDRAGNRTQAIGWYQQALKIQEGDLGIRECAELGLKQPLTWIRHLDQSNEPSKPTPAPRPPAKGYVTTGQPPEGLVPAETLSPQEQRENFDFLCRAIDETYADFELKSIRWNDICQRYQAQLGPNTTADGFYRLVFRLVAELKDTHSWLQNYHPRLPASAPDLTLELFDGKPFVVAVGSGSDAARLGVKPGSEILEVDGLPLDKKLEALRPEMRGCSTERALRREACRHLLTGDKGASVNLKLRSPDGHDQLFSLERVAPVKNPTPPACPFELRRQKFVQFGQEPSGLGYIRVLSFEGREQIAEEFDRALEALRAAPGIILDIRNNPGGFGQQRIVGRFLSKSTLCAIGYRKNGPAHADLKREDDVLEPTGSWQYTGPVALLINDVTGSAADLFACYLHSAGRVVTVGSTTHGNLAGVAAYAVMPCGLVVRISNAYMCDATGKPIEGAGNQPDVTVAATVADFLAGKDPVLARAIAVIQQQISREPSGA